MENSSNISEKLISSTQYTSEENYWLNQLSGHPGKSTFPRDYKRTGEYKTRQEHITFSIPGEICAKIIEISKGSVLKIYMILTAALMGLLDKYSYERNKDIIIGAPIYKQETRGDFINTVLALKNRVDEHISFKGLLRQVRKTIIDANENANYPIEILLYQIDLPAAADDFPLFDVGILLKNIHYRSYLKDIHLNMVFSFFKTGENIHGDVEYNALWYDRITIQRIVRHYTQLLKGVLKHPYCLMGQVEILSEEDKQQVLSGFNQTGLQFPDDQTVNPLFEKQAEKIPENTAVVYEDKHLTFGGLNEKANGLARVLRCKGVNRDIIVGIMVSRCLEMITGMLAVLKAGGAYLPIDPDYPEARKKFMLEDSQTRLLVTQKELLHQNIILETISKEDIIDLQEENSYAQETFNLQGNHKPDDLIYVIYTSGTTGQPKGVLIRHKGFVNLVYAHQKVFEENPGSRVSQSASISFDAMAFELWPCLSNGASLYIAPDDIRMEPVKMKKWLISREITISFQPTMMFEWLLREEWLPKGVALKALRTAGDKLNRCPVRQYPFCLYNLYGPTEDTVWTTWTEVTFETDEGKDPTIGKPVGNHQVYIVGTTLHPQPIGVPGELCISGVGLARGYLNRPQLTAEKFIRTVISPYNKTNKRFTNDQCPLTNDCLYRTGDLARWLPDGNIDFIGRIDSQVKIRGFRIELEEIESQILKINEIKEAVVVARENETSEKFLCAYTVSQKEFNLTNLRYYLSGKLPGYMIPSYFMNLDKIPLTPNGKVDRKALPAPGIEAGEHYKAPRDEFERKLVDIWSEILEVEKEKIGINDNFFHLGGHSLKATVLVSRIHQELNINIPLTGIFKTPYIQGLAACIKEAARSKPISVQSVEKKEYYPLSSTQRRLYILQQMDAKGGTPYNIPSVWQLEGELDGKKIEIVFQQLIRRHESLRTFFTEVNDNPVQRIKVDGNNFRISSEIPISADEPGDRLQVEVESFIRPFNLSQAPLLRVRLIKLLHTPTALRRRPSLAAPTIHQEESPGNKYILMVDMHHIICDGVSIGIFVKEFTQLYGGKSLPALKLQYRDYSEWHNRQVGGEFMKEQQTYWLKQFAGEVPVLDIAVDYPRPVVQGFAGRTLHFEINKKETAALKSLARERDVTLFMLLLSIYTVFLSILSGQEDIVVGTPIANRRHSNLESIMGMFVNTLALRNFPVMEKTFGQFLGEIKENTIKAFENQDYLYEDLVEQVVVERDTGRNPLFDTMFALQNMDTPAVQIPGLKVLPYDYKNRGSKFDLTLTAVELEDRLVSTFEYRTLLFRRETIRRFASYFKITVSTVLDKSEIRISEIDVLSQEEKKRVLLDFNDTGAEYPRDKTIHQLFAEQVEQRPDNIAIIGEMQSVERKAQSIEWNKERHAPCAMRCALTYRELNNQSNRLAYILTGKGVKTDIIVGIMVERSIEMIIGILGILKAGGAYLPIDPDYPQDRIDYMLKDSGAKILVTSHDLSEKYEKFLIVNCQLLMVNEKQPKRRRLNKPPKEANSINNYQLTINNLQLEQASLAYIIYTSGTTGQPKGSLVEHRNIVRLLFNDKFQFDFGGLDIWTMFHSYCFDFSVWEMYGALFYGGKLVIIPKWVSKDPQRYLEILEKERVTVLNQTPSAFYNLINEALNHWNREIKPGIKYVIFGGEMLMPTKLKKWKEKYAGVKIINMFGITETTVHVTYKEIGAKEIENNISNIGKPIPTLTTYVLDKNLNPLPIGVAGELCVGGKGVARGYLNRPELSGEKFVGNLYKQGDRLYKSGDLARFLENGDLEYLGRIDHQVKIRGFRIELGEIENRLLTHEKIKEAIVLLREDNNDKNLCAYLVAKPGETDSIDQYELREYLSNRLPDYMVPSYFVQLDNIPLTPNGKVDRKALPKPRMKTGKNYIAPQNEIEKKLAEIWSEILDVRKENIGIHDNFFHLGGHSLNATVLVSRIHKTFDVKVQLTGIFKTSTIKRLARYISEMREEKFHPIEAVARKEYYDVSSAQKRLFVLNILEGENTTNYNVPGMILIKGKLDKQRLDETFKTLIKRHEALRTSFLMIKDKPVQIIHDNDHIEFKIKYAECSEEEARKKANKFLKPFDLGHAPLIRVELLSIGEYRYILMIDIHHIVADGTSIEILEKEFYVFYQRGILAPLKIQYKDFTQWQNRLFEDGDIKKQEDYWLTVFKGNIPVLNLPTDYPRPPHRSLEGKLFYFRLSRELTEKIRNLTAETGTTLYMVLLAVYNILLSKYSLMEEIIVGTPVSGRNHADLKNVIGSFANMLAMKNHPQKSKLFSEFLNKVKRNSLRAFDNQDYQFEELIAKLDQTIEPGRNPLFDVVLNVENRKHGNMDRKESKNEEWVMESYEFDYNASKYDLLLRVLEDTDNLGMSLEYPVSLFKSSTVEKIAEHFLEILIQVVKNKDITLKDITISYEVAIVSNPANENDAAFNF